MAHTLSGAPAPPGMYFQCVRCNGLFDGNGDTPPTISPAIIVPPRARRVPPRAPRDRSRMKVTDSIGIGFIVIAVLISVLILGHRALSDLDAGVKRKKELRQSREEAERINRAPQATPKKQEASAEEQADAKAAVQELMQQGAFAEVTVDGGVATATVTDAYMALSFKHKEAGAMIVAIWAFKIPRGGNMDGSLVILRHVRTGKQVGKYSAFGLSID